MRWGTTADVAAFQAAAGAFLRADPVGNTLVLTIAETLRVRGPHAFGTEDPLFGWLVSGAGEVAGTFLHTPPYPLLLGVVPVSAAPALVEVVGGRPLPGVGGPVDVAHAVAEGVAAVRGVGLTVRRRERLYRLSSLTPPSSPPAGRPVLADAARRDLIVAWYEAFAAEVGEAHAAMGGVVDDRLGHNGLWLWEDEAGEPVSLAGHSRVLAGMARVGPVYTPPEHRGHGYAGALTAATSSAAMRAGASEVLLFTDLANPTSNGVYQRIGFVPVDDRVSLEFV
jgi:GNAT superfamily N-acetyltransferase